MSFANWSYPLIRRGQFCCGATDECFVNQLLWYRLYFVHKLILRTFDVRTMTKYFIWHLLFIFFECDYLFEIYETVNKNNFNVKNKHLLKKSFTSVCLRLWRIIVFVCRLIRPRWRERRLILFCVSVEEIRITMTNTIETGLILIPQVKICTL